MDLLDFEKPLESEDYYKIIGCTELSTTEQILTEYRIKAKKFHPDKNPSDQNAASEFAKLLEAKDVLTDPERRKEYEQWKNSGLQISFKRWKSLGGSLKMSMHWATKSTNKTPMVSDGKEAEPSNSMHLQTSSGPLPFSDTLKKFRNYEI